MKRMTGIVLQKDKKLVCEKERERIKQRLERERERERKKEQRLDKE